jgi:aldehyde dehydrogenase (NAD+)
VKVLPFGGVGESGYGRQVLKHTFECFSYDRASINVPVEIEQLMIGRYPPYTKQSFEAECGPGLNVQIPGSSPEDGMLP